MHIWVILFCVPLLIIGRFAIGGIDEEAAITIGAIGASVMTTWIAGYGLYAGKARMYRGREWDRRTSPEAYWVAEGFWIAVALAFCWALFYRVVLR